MKPILPRSLAFKIGLSIVAIEVAALSLLGSFYLRRFSAQVDRSLEEALARPGILMSRGTLNLNMIAERGALDQLVGPGLVEALVIGANSNVFHTTHPEHVGRPVSEAVAWKNDWLDRARNAPLVLRETEGNDTFLTRISPISVGEGRAPFLFAFVKMRTTEAMAEKAGLRRLFILGSAATVVATSLALLLSFRMLVTRPLARVAGTVDRVAAGDLAARVGGRVTADEIGQMHLGVDQMAAKLQATIASLESTVAKLNAAIADRKVAEDERLRLERQVLHAQKLESLGMLAGGIAHDFNNILTAILGQADLALMEIAPDAPGRANLLEIDKAAQRAADLARQMLAYSGKGHFVIADILINHLVREMGQLLAVSVSKKVKLRYDLQEGLPAIRGDATQIGQIVMNLITNASEAIGENRGTVVIRTGSLQCTRAYLDEGNAARHPGEESGPAEGTYVFVEVDDNGCGMDATTVERIFDPFFTTKFTGRGLGLAAVLGIVRGHRGAIKIRSVPGEGTTFRVLFPASAQAALLAPAAPPAPEPDQWRGQGVILHVDDEEQVRTLCRDMLAELGFEVLTATDGREAIDLLREQGRSVRCVLLDMTMPLMDGEAVFREIQALLPGLPVILCSGYSEQSVAERFGDRRPGFFLQKPFTFAALATILRTVLEPAGALTEIGGGKPS